MGPVVRLELFVRAVTDRDDEITGVEGIGQESWRDIREVQVVALRRGQRGGVDPLPRMRSGRGGGNGAALPQEGGR